MAGGATGRGHRALAGGAAVSAVADEIGWSARNMQRQCAAVYGYGPDDVAAVLRFRRAVALLRSGVHRSPAAASRAGYADQPHLHRQVRELAGLSPAAVSPRAARTDRPRCRRDRARWRNADPTARRTVPEHRCDRPASTGPTLRRHRPVRSAPNASTTRPADVGGVHPGCIPAMVSSVSNSNRLPPGSSTSTCGPSVSGTARPRSR